jgi:hypothetical protein
MRSIRSASSRNTVPARCRDVRVVANDEWPALVITAVSLAPDAASSVIAVCLRSWNGRTRPSMPAAFSAAAKCGLQISFE